MRVALFVTASAALIAVSPSVSFAQVERDSTRSGRIESEFAPPIDLWLDQISYDRGAHMRPYFSTEPGAYVVVVRVSSDGELRVMYPSRPSEQKPYMLGQMADDRVPYRGDPAFRLYESSGTGFVFAIASYQRFDFSYFTQGRAWSTARLATFGRYGDPFQVLRNFVDRVLPTSAEFSLDYEVYEVYSRGNNGVYANSVYGGGIYGNQYGYNSLSDYHDSCITAFGYRYSTHCRSFNGGYYGPIIVNNPRPVPPKEGKMRKPRPVVPDPLVPTTLESGPIEGTQPTNRSDERAARQRYERMRRQTETRSPGTHPIMTSPRVERQPGADTRERAPVIYRTAPARSEPRSQPRSEPRAMEGRQPVRSMPSSPARVEVRNEPRPAPAPRSEPKAQEKAKEN